MTHFGQIKSYDTDKGLGMIAPEKGGEPLGFVKADLKQDAAAPVSGQRFSYETKRNDKGKDCATRLNHQEQQGANAGKDEQAKQQKG